MDMSLHTSQTFWHRLQKIVVHPVFLLTVAMLVGLGLRLYRLDFRDYWDDEVISTLAARASLSQLYTNVSDYSIHPPLYYMTLHLWSVFGNDIVTLRLFSVLINILCIPLVYLLGRMLHIPTMAALAAAVLFALSPFHIFHSQQARMYPLLTLLVIIATVCFYKTWQRGSWGWGLGLVVSVALGCHIHVYFPLSIVGLNVWLLWDSILRRTFDTRQWIRLIAAQALGVLFFLPFAPQLFGTATGVVTSFWTSSISPFYGILAAIGLSNFANDPATPLPESLQLLGTFAAAIMFVLSVYFPLRATWHNNDERSAWVLLHCMIWTPVVLATIISLTLKPILTPRYLTGITPFLFLLIGWAMVRFWHNRLMQVTSVVFGLSIGATLFVMYPAVPSQSSLIEMARYLHNHQQPGDVIAYTDWQSFDAAVLIDPTQPDVFLVTGTNVWTGAEEWYERMQFVDWHEPENVGAVADFAPEYRRVWLVLTNYGYDVPYHQEVTQGWLEEHGELVETISYKRGAVYLYEVAEPATPSAE